MKVLVTGADGFIGSRVLANARERGWTALGSSRSGERQINADVTNVETFGDLKGAGLFDAVVHCAGIAHRFGPISDEEYYRVNVDGTRNIAGLAAEVGARHFVLLSSVMVYGRHGSGISENEVCRPRDVYADSKLRSEEAAAEVGSRTGMRVTILRPAPVIGEGAKGNFVRLVSAIDRRRFMNIGDGSNRKSLVYVGDVANACLDVAGEREGPMLEVYNVAGEPITTGSIVTAICCSLGSARKPLSVPSAPVRFAARVFSSVFPITSVRSLAHSVETWLSEDVYLTQAIQQRYGIVCRTPLDDAISRTVEHYVASKRS